jgi:hypothetical protein
MPDPESSMKSNDQFAIGGNTFKRLYSNVRSFLFLLLRDKLHC